MESPETAFNRAYASLLFATSNYALLVFDHMLTFGDEVEAIWSQPFNFATLLFYMNRYITHANLIVNQVAFASDWPHEVCRHFVKFEGIMTVILVAVADMILILRVYCLYARSKVILTGLLGLWVAQIVVGAYGLVPGIPVPLPPPLTGCILTSPYQTIALVWAGPAVTDTIIFALTLFKTLRNRSFRRAALDGPSLIDIILRDGIIYFTIVFAVNLMNILIYVSAPPDLKVVGATFSQVLSCLMVSRLQINLRRYTTASPHPTTLTTFRSPPRSRAATTGGGSGGRSSQPLASHETTTTLFGSWDIQTKLGIEANTFLSLGNLGEELTSSLWSPEKEDVPQEQQPLHEDIELEQFS